MTPLGAGPGQAPAAAPPGHPGTAHPPAGPARAGGGLRLLRGLRADGAPMTLTDHLAAHGMLPGSGPDVIALAEASGLLGRGGGNFPLGTKMRAARDGSTPRRRPVVVVNAAESEPASRKDFLLVTRAPHLVLDGAAAAARALGATEAVVWLHRGRPAMAAVLRAALAERAAARLADPVFRLVEGPSRYVSGQATAAVAYLGGGKAIPFPSPVPMARRGIGGKPTLVSNAETLAQLALVVRHGAAAFRSAGTMAEPGTMLVTTVGAVASPGVVEAAVGTPVRHLLQAAGGVIGDPVGALLVGGYAGSWLPQELADLPYSRAGLAGAGADPGVGMVVVLPAGACPVVETARLAAWLADEGVGQCGPCLNGLPALAAECRLLAYGGPNAAGAPDRLRRWAGMVEGRGACHHPDGVVRLVRSLLLGFGEEVARHAGGAPCRAALPAIVLPGRGSGGWR
jgi:NADH:ubiquinone oxidoreductase subunit F (NADH-binding)